MLAAIIQARLGSSRLQGKAMLDICGKPMLGRVIDRVKMALDNIVVATPDAEIAKFAETQGVSWFIGSENDVLDRYYQAAKAFNVDPIVRITSDNPLLDPAIIKKVIEFYEKNNFDYVSNAHPHTYLVGLDVEVCSFKMLERAWTESSDPYDREHVTPYLYRHGLFRVGNVENDIDLSHLRWTVDYQEDLDFAREIYSKLGGNFTMGDILKLGGNV